MSGKKFQNSGILYLYYSLRKSGIWKDLREALAGNDRDFTDIKLSRAILILAIPMVLEMIMESVFAVVDIYFVSRLGAEAVATVGITESLLTLVYAIGFGLSISTTALVSRRIGEKHNERAAFTAVQAILTGLFLSLLIAVPGFIFPSELLKLMGSSDSMVTGNYLYPMILLGSNGIIMLLFIINAVFRSSGDAALSLRVLVLANVLNMILDPCMIFGLGPFPEMGIAGAAIATTTGRGIAVLYQFYLLGKGNGRIKIYARHFRLSYRIIAKLIKLSLGGIGQSIITTSSWIGMVRIIAIFGSEVLAGYTIAIRIVIFALLPSWGLANAAATLVGQNLGANKPDRAEKSVWVASFVNMALLGALSLVMITRTADFIGFFTTEAGVLDSGIVCLRMISFGFLFYALGMVMIQAFNGAGDTSTPTWMNFLCFWILEIPLAWILAIVADFGESGVYLSIIIAESSLAILAMIMFKKGKWKSRKV